MNGKANSILMILSSVFIMAVAVTSAGIAYAGGMRGIGLASVSFLLTFGVVVILAQVMPAVILLSSLAGVTLSLVKKTEVPVRGN